MHDHIRIACVRGTAFEVESWVASCCAQEEGHLRDDDAVSKPDPEIESLSILEALPNQLLLPNGEAAASDHDRFRLSDGELGFVRRPIPGQRMVLSRNPRSSTVLNAVPKALGLLLAALGGGQAGVNTVGADYTARFKFWKR